MSSAVNHRKRSHRSHNKAYSAQRTLWAGAARQEVKKQGPFGRILGRFGKRESRAAVQDKGGEGE